jgi:[NiFe] hydrogenase diaphorase moiety large subunit
MTIAGYAIGASEGLLYLRGEYAYLLAYLESVLTRRRTAGLLGQRILGKAAFNFDIRIQLGGGAYICGEETALISSCEGLRGDPRNRPPFPAQRGYLGKPTAVNNVETLCCVPRILEMGAGWFASIGTSKSTGTKLLSDLGRLHAARDLRGAARYAARGSARDVRRRGSHGGAGRGPQWSDGGRCRLRA